MIRQMRGETVEEEEEEKVDLKEESRRRREKEKEGKGKKKREEKIKVEEQGEDEGALRIRGSSVGTRERTPRGDGDAGGDEENVEMGVEEEEAKPEVFSTNDAFGFG